MSEFMREDAVDDFLNAEAINYQLRKAGNDVIADDGSDIDRLTGDTGLPNYIPARNTHLVQPTDAELHAYDHDEPECWPYDCSEMPCDSEECDDECDECEDDDFDVEDLFSDELEALDDLETDIEDVEDEVIEDDDYEEVDDEDYY